MQAIFKIAGFGYQKTLWISGLNNIFYTFATLICVFTLDRIDLLFAAKSPFVWAAETNFKRLIAENPTLGAAHRRGDVADTEKALAINLEHS